MSKFFEALERAEKERARRVETIEPVVTGSAGREGPPSVVTEDSRSGDRVRGRRRHSTRRRYPDIIDGLSDRIDDHLIGLLAPNAPEAEHYRRLCQLILEKKQSSALSAIAISSPGPSDGKTTTSVNVAGLLAHHPGARVLLLEADLRAPSLAAQLGLTTSRGRGLADAITHPSVTLESVMVQYRPLNLRIVPAGDAFGHPYDLISSPRFGALLTQVRHEFDHVIVDAPPLTPFPDCRIIASWVDALIIVVGAHRTSRRLLEEGLTTVDPAKILGLLFNGADRSTRELAAYTHGWRENGRGRPTHTDMTSRRPWLFGRKATRP